MLPTSSLRLADLLADPLLLSIPSYQRPYSWTVKEAGQLLDDLVEASGVDGGPGEPDYFLGAILLLATDGGGLPDTGARGPARSFDIVDGQQRLATLTMLACALRDCAEALPRLIGDRLNALVSPAAGSGSLHRKSSRIELGPESEFFSTYVQRRGGCLELPDEQDVEGPAERILAVRDHFVHAVSEIEAAKCAKLATYLCEACHVVVILASDIDRAHRLFTVLNERGKPLLRHDILKADIVRAIPVDRRADAIAKWQQADTRLGRDFDDFLSHIYHAFGRSESKIIAGIRGIVRDFGGPEPFLQSLFVPLANSYEIVRRAADMSLPLDSDVRRHLIYLGRLSGGDWAPAAMLALNQYKDDPGYAKVLIGEIDRLAHLLRLLRMSSSKRIRRFAPVIEAIKARRRIEAGSATFQITKDEIKTIQYHLRALHPRGAAFCKLLLLRLDDELSRSVSVCNPADYTVEHVLPQRIGKTREWRRVFADQEERAAATESLGNLVVVTQLQNDRAGNSEYSRKREVYAAAAEDRPILAITREVAELSAWRAMDVWAREERLLRLIGNMWSIDVAGAAGQGSRRGRSTG